MALTIAQLKQAFAKKESDNSNNGFWDMFYPFYKMNFGETAIFRFLPDADTDNPFMFFIENKYHELTINGKKKKFACLKMHDGTDAHCPFCEKSASYYGKGDKETGLLFWRRIDYILQGVVISSPFDYPINPDENPCRMISLGMKLYNTIEQMLIRGDMDDDDNPLDITRGYDFRISKTKQGEYADYSTSAFARKPSAIPEKFIQHLELHDLKKYRYTRVEADQMELMIEAYFNGQSYVHEKESETTKHVTGNQALDTQLNEFKSPALTTSSPAEVIQGSSTETTNDTPVKSKRTPQEILADLKKQHSQG